ncbi:DNA-binding protein H-NS [Paraburkholderia atlantica]|uniref:DNA-binding protein H-NS n=1 Tax=Paraburkholderia atlantica TaxID=2654982 RepID=A0A6I1QII6_PARAM|nr:H-NS histone family protein [Paraburkholderia atlantica]MBB5429708.1 DNA-binding protein H-NS [Paraburkholderia atlantica]MPW11450.1 H-NS histone family protein [Paraburkholderia atlantica]NUY35876.1 H-NS histone family protein [Paraburkholderia atlantica]
MKLLNELKAQLAELNAEIETARAAEVEQAIADCRALIDLYELTASDLGFVKTQTVPANRGTRTFRAKAPRAAIPPIYRDPKTGATWSGRGRVPRWMDGQDRADFLING